MHFVTSHWITVLADQWAKLYPPDDNPPSRSPSSPKLPHYVEEPAPVCLPWHCKVFPGFVHDLLNMALRWLCFMYYLCPVKHFRRFWDNSAVAFKKTMVCIWRRFTILHKAWLQKNKRECSLSQTALFSTSKLVLGNCQFWNHLIYRLKNQNKTFWTCWNGRH